MKRALALMSLPFYAVGIAVGVCRVALSLYRLEGRLARYRREADEQRAAARARLEVN